MIELVDPANMNKWYKCTDPSMIDQYVTAMWSYRCDSREKAVPLFWEVDAFWREQYDDEHAYHIPPGMRLSVTESGEYFGKSIADTDAEKWIFDDYTELLQIDVYFYDDVVETAFALRFTGSQS